MGSLGGEGLTGILILQVSWSQMETSNFKALCVCVCVCVCVSLRACMNYLIND